jgi:hypothetical protein
MERLIFILLFPLTLFAEELTTNNLITNGTFDNGTTGWTLSGDAVRINDCCPGGHDLEFGDSGSIEQSFNLITDTITQPMLDNGITLNSSVEVQNGECGVAQCWGGQGGADSFTIRLQIRDSNNEILATTSQTRTNVTGINGKDFQDTLSYTGINSNIGNILISGTDANAPASLGGPNVDNISVTMTYDDTVLTATQTQELQEIEEIISFIETEPIEFTELFEEVTVREFIEEEYHFEILTEMVELKEEEKFVEESIVLEIYEEPETEQEVATEIESEEIVVAEEQTGTEEVSSREESSITEEESTTSNVETQEETRTENSSSQPTNTDTETTEQTIVAEDVRVDSVQDISEQIARTTLDIDQQLILTQNLVAKVMSNNDMITGYTKVNTDIFKQPNLVNINIDSYINNIYTDNRDIYPNQYYEDRLWTSRQ